MLMLESLERGGIVKRIAADSVVKNAINSQSEVDDEDNNDESDDLGWDEARFFLTDRWISA